MLRRNGPVIESVESVLRPEESLWWERFVEDVGFEPGDEGERVFPGENDRLHCSNLSFLSATYFLTYSLCGPGNAIGLLCVCVRTITDERNDL